MENNAVLVNFSILYSSPESIIVTILKVFPCIWHFFTYLIGFLKLIFLFWDKITSEFAEINLGHST